MTEVYYIYIYIYEKPNPIFVNPYCIQHKKENPYYIYIYLVFYLPTYIYIYILFFICRQWKTGNNSNEIQMLTPFKKLQFEFDHLESKMWNSIY